MVGEDTTPSAMAPFVSRCPACEAHTIFSTEHRLASDQQRSGVVHLLATCAKCGLPALFVQGGEGREHTAAERVYPAPRRHIGYDIPASVRESYEEAVRCEESGVATACVVMVGRTLEAVCKEHEPKTTSIFDGLKRLHEAGAISHEMKEWANQIRVLRNYGAHASDGMTAPADAREALDFLQAIMEIMYDLRPRFGRLKKRVAQRSVPEAGGDRGLEPGAAQQKPDP